MMTWCVFLAGGGCAFYTYICIMMILKSVLVSGGIPLLYIQKFLMGYEDISTTESYIKHKENPKEVLVALEKIV